MAIIKLEEVTLYTDSVLGNFAENIKADAFFERQGIPYRRVIFNSKEYAEDVLARLNKEHAEHNSEILTKLPVLTYVEVHDDIPARLSPVRCLEGLTRIQEFPSLYFSIESQ